MVKLLDNCHHLFTDNLFATSAAANYLLERCTFMTETMRRSQLQYIPNEIVATKPKVGEKVYYQKERYLAMSYRQKQSHNKPVIMLLTFCGAFDVPDRKKANKTFPAILDMYNQSMGGVDSSDQVMYSYTDDRKSKSWSKKVAFNLLSRLFMNSYILYKLTVRNPKSRLEFIKEVIDFLASESKAIVGDPFQPHAATKKLTQLPGSKER